MRIKEIGYTPECGKAEIDWNGTGTTIQIDDDIGDEEIIPDPEGDGIASGIVWLVDSKGQIRVARGEASEWETLEGDGWDLLPDPAFA
jgi:hypothetical protein